MTARSSRYEAAMQLSERPIAIDARLNAYRIGGIPAYTRELARALAAAAPEQRWLIAQHRKAHAPLVMAPNAREAHLWTPPHHRLEQLALPLELLRFRPALLHSPDFIPPLRRPWPAVITIHDLAFLHFPEILDAGARRFYGQIHAAAAGAQSILADSEATRRDIVELLQIDPAKIHIVYPAATPSIQYIEHPAPCTIAGQLLHPDTFLLFVSTLEPRKNVPTLLRALHLARERRPEAGYRLVLAGARGWLDDPIVALASELRLGDALLVAGSVSDEELSWLYSACAGYLNPSLYEGFGLPALEALTCRAAVAVSNTSSLPEAVGDAALLVEPRDVEGWADAIQRLWHDEALRADLRGRAPAQAARFSWARAAEQTLAIYRQVLGDR